jgi:hypothetical protein
VGGDERAGRTVGSNLRHPHDDRGTLLDGLGAGAAVEVGVGVARIDGVDPAPGNALAYWIVIALIVVLDAG